MINKGLDKRNMTRQLIYTQIKKKINDQRKSTI